MHGETNGVGVNSKLISFEKLKRPPVRRVIRRPGSFSCRFALIFLSPSHFFLGSAGEGRELASSEIRARVLRRRGYAAVLSIQVDAWLRLVPEQRDVELKEALAACLSATKSKKLLF